MIVLPPDIILDKPINEASYLDYCKIDWEGHTFVTLNSVYSFEFLNPEE